MYIPMLGVTAGGGGTCPCAPRLNPPLNKASYEYGIAAEHVKYASTTLAPVLASLFNTILDHGQIPGSFKTGYITPIHKEGKGPQLVENYRGITVASIFGKLFETLLFLRLPTIDKEQSDLQFGFTKGLSPYGQPF